LSDNRDAERRMEAMARHTSKIAARVPRELADELDEICLREGLRNRSDALRVCIEQYVEAKRESWNTDAMVIRVPNALLDMVDRLVNSGAATDRNEAFIMALSSWVDSRVALYARGELERLEQNLAKIGEGVRDRKLSEREGKGLVRR
jgi:metal-responsive CopG/Arc/MetJ family transcriptional regulator